MREFIISKNDSGQRLNKFLEKAVPRLPGGLMHKYLRLKRIKCNGKRAEAAQRLKEGDVLQLYLNDEFFEQPDADTAYQTASAQLDIVYEDAHILLVNKPAGLVVHADEAGSSDTLIARIQAYLYQFGQWSPEQESSFTPSLCNRIDRGTSGIVIAAKTAEALRVLNQKIRDREIHKQYLCAVCGDVQPPQGRIHSYLLRHEDEHRVTVHKNPVPGARTAITDYRVLRQTAELSLVECTLITGRTHQIRAHFASIGHPLLGDSKYGSNEYNRRYHRKSQCLCSYKLRFAFTTDAGALAYLDGMTFTVEQVEFTALFDGASVPKPTPQRTDKSKRPINRPAHSGNKSRTQKQRRKRHGKL